MLAQLIYPLWHSHHIERNSHVVVQVISQSYLPASAPPEDEHLLHWHDQSPWKDLCPRQNFASTRPCKDSPNCAFPSFHDFEPGSMKGWERIKESNTKIFCSLLFFFFLHRNQTNGERKKRKKDGRLWSKLANYMGGERILQVDTSQSIWRVKIVWLFFFFNMIKIMYIQTDHKILLKFVG